jgi:hypothetical protein
VLAGKLPSSFGPAMMALMSLWTMLFSSSSMFRIGSPALPSFAHTESSSLG